MTRPKPISHPIAPWYRQALAILFSFACVLTLIAFTLPHILAIIGYSLLFRVYFSRVFTETVWTDSLLEYGMVGSVGLIAFLILPLPTIVWAGITGIYFAIGIYLTHRNYSHKAVFNQLSTILL